jgi:hypothetical protein
LHRHRVGVTASIDPRLGACRDGYGSHGEVRGAGKHLYFDGDNGNVRQPADFAGRRLELHIHMAAFDVGGSELIAGGAEDVGR